MAGIEKIEDKARTSPENIPFSDLVKLCTAYFGEPRTGQGGSHWVFKTPWQGDPRINLQDKGGKAKSYQVKQALKAIDKCKDSGDADSNPGEEPEQPVTP